MTTGHSTKDRPYVRLDNGPCVFAWIGIIFASLFFCDFAWPQERLALSAADTHAILQDCGLRQVGNHYMAAGCSDHLQAQLEPVDLNHDGRPEVILTVSGSPCFSGLMQSNVSIYFQDSHGVWRDVLGFVPAFGVRVQSSQTKGFADLALTVLGGCDPLYRWAGASYFYAGQISGYEQECGHRR